MPNQNSMLYPNLRIKMSHHGYSINDLAKKLKIHPTTCRRKITGQSSWTLEELNTISDLLNAEIKELFKKTVA